MRLIDYTYYALYISTMIFSGLMVLTMYVDISSGEANQYVRFMAVDPISDERPEKNWMTRCQYWLFPICLVVCATCLTVAVIFVLRNINNYFQKKLQKEADRIKKVFIIYVISYLTRACFYIMIKPLMT